MIYYPHILVKYMVYYPYLYQFAVKRIWYTILESSSVF
jgi:hypothetical protein